MPAARPRASFEPIPPDFDVHTFVETAENFQYVDRISYEMIGQQGIEQFEKLVLLHVIIGGKPLVIDGFEEVLDPWTFTPSWLRDNHGDKVENARNLTTKESIPLTVRHYLKHLDKLTEQFFNSPERYRDKTRQRIYLKDIDCPQVWQDKVKEHIPLGLFYLNESTGEMGGPGALDEPGGRKGRGIARAGDLMSSLPPEMRAENLMCYIGHEGTYTPAHREMCASLGQNIMVNASGNISEDGKPERPGSSLWFMTESKDRQVVSEYWLSILGHDIEVENHFAQLIAWKKAPFKTYVVEQRPGDFILIPPLAPHQVWNRGTRTMKIAWNRTTVETLEMAMSEALPNSRVVCRDEQYKNKTIVYYTLLKYSNLIKSARAQVELGGEQAEAIRKSVKVRHVQRDFKRLFDLYKDIVLSEMFAPESREHVEFLPYDSNVTCAYCRCNIFNRFLTCKTCKNAFSKEIDEPYDVCMDCYGMGRSCACQAGYQWCEQWKWRDLLHKYEEWRAQIIEIDGRMTEKTPLPLQEERRYLGKKTLAQVCQEQLKVRPFIDPNAPKPVEDESEEEEVQVDEYGMVKKSSKKRSRQWLSKHKSCHFCLHRHPKWKMALCTNCDLAYCYGTLFRAHDMMPLTVMENPTWKCPHCRRTCNTGACRRDPRQHPYEPKGTLLGHDTKKVADPRSVECLVDFSVSNLNWLREDEVTGQNGAMQRRRDEAERAKLNDPTLDDRYMDEDNEFGDHNGIAYSPVDDGNGTTSVGPSSVTYRSEAAGRDDDSQSYYPDPNLSGDIPRLGKRNRDDDDEEENSRWKKKQPQRQKKKKYESTQQALPKNILGKQYHKEQDKRTLDKAKQDGRLNIVQARLKNKSKIVKLPLSRHLLGQIELRLAPEHLQVRRSEQEADEPLEDGPSILQSDILPKTNGAHKTTERPRGPTLFRVRVEEDTSYGSRRRGGESAATAKPGKSGRISQKYEELTLDSDEDEFADDLVEYAGPSTGRPKGRSSAWLARKNEGEEDLPTELPPDFKDGDINRGNRDLEKERERKKRKKTILAKPEAGIRPASRPSGRPIRESTMSDEDDIYENDNGNEALILAQSAAAAVEVSREAMEEKARAEAVEEKARAEAVEEKARAEAAEEKARAEAAEEKARAEAAAKEVEDNMRAKMAIWNADSDNDSLHGFIDSLAAEVDNQPLNDVRDEPAPTESRSAPPQTGNSILSRPGMSRKKIKIVASKRNSGFGLSNKTTTPTTTRASASSFTTVNKNTSRAVVDLSSESESDSNDAIPAKAPTPKVSGLGRPGGRPLLVPTRGSTVKRGRGRPRKTL